MDYFLDNFLKLKMEARSRLVSEMRLRLKTGEFCAADVWHIVIIWMPIFD